MGVMLEKDLLLWGHSLNDYRAMFALDAADLQLKLLDCAAGLSSANAELNQQGGSMVSCDPLYQAAVDDIRHQASLVLSGMAEQIQAHVERFVWQRYRGLDDLIAARRQSVDVFLDDFSRAKDSGRYQAAAMPNLPFQDKTFDLALCSHALFATSSFDTDFYSAALEDMLRVAHEVRIFPLLDASGEVSPLVGPVMAGLHNANYGVELKAVDYELQKGGNALLRVWHTECLVYSQTL